MPNKRSRGEVRNGKLQKVAADPFLKRGYEGVPRQNSIRALSDRFGGRSLLVEKRLQEQADT